MGVQLLPPLEQYINRKNFHGHNICILSCFSMKFFNYSNFDAFFPTVVNDFRYCIFEICLLHLRLLLANGGRFLESGLATKK